MTVSNCLVSVELRKQPDEVTELILCAACGRRLAGAVVRRRDLPEPRRRDADGYDYRPTMAQGEYAVDPLPGSDTGERARSASIGDLVVNPADTSSLAEHPDASRQAGCCGHDGLGGPNRICAPCGAEVATLRDDCWTLWRCGSYRRRSSWCASMGDRTDSGGGY